MTVLDDVSIEKWKTQHIPYRLQMLDGLRWWCAFRASGDDLNIELTVNGERVSASLLTNSVTESGLMACRFLLEFLSLRAAKDHDSPTRLELVEIGKKYRDDHPEDVWAERIGCKSATPNEIGVGDRQVCGYAHKAASLGVAHPNDGPEGVELEWLIQAANIIEMAVIDKIYDGRKTSVRSSLWSVASPK